MLQYIYSFFEEEKMVFIKLLDGIDKNWSTIEKAKYLYNQIGKNTSYDERFAYGDDAELMHKIFYRDVDIKKDEDTRIVCHTANKIYLQLLQELKIKAKLVYKNHVVERKIPVKDVALVFWDENGNKYFTNLAGDIENCKFGLRTAFFGIQKNLYEEAQDVSEIPNDEQKKIDRKVGVIQQDYNDIVFKLLAGEVKNTNNFMRFLRGNGIDTESLSREDIFKEKMYYINKLIKFRDKTAGPDELKKFYKYLFSASVLDKFESKKFNTYEFVKNNGKEVEILSVIELNLAQESPIYYMFSEQEMTYIQLLEDEILEATKGFRERRNKKMLVQRSEKAEYEGEEH